MPEGDTILRTARTLGRVLEGRTVSGARSPLPGVARHAPRLVGRRIESVEAQGKHLLMRFDDGSLLLTHMRMTGSWHLYPTGERWERAEGQARMVLETEGAVAVCFSAPVVRLLTAFEARGHPWLARPAPDVLAVDADIAAIVARLRSCPDLPLGEAIVAQRLVAGIGNIYKCETLFLCAADPFSPVEAFSDAALGQIVETARGLMRRNLHGHPRRTRFVAGGGPYWVYGRSGEPCFRCGGGVRMRRQGEAARSTYHCPVCQGVPARPGDSRGEAPTLHGVP